MVRIRVRLLWFLLAIGLIGAASGMSARYYITSHVRFIAAHKQIGRTNVAARWVEDWLGRQKLKYIVIAPHGEKILAGMADNRITSKRFPEQIEIQGLDLEQSRLYFQGKSVPNSENGRAWIYRTSKQTLEEIEPGVRQTITTQEFANLEQSSLWRRFKPIADAEAEAWLAHAKEN